MREQLGLLPIQAVGMMGGIHEAAVFENHGRTHQPMEGQWLKNCNRVTGFPD